jgi:Stage II sporulation protein M
VSVNEFVLVQGLRDTRGAFERWNERPGPVLRDWFGGASAVACALLVAVWAVGEIATPDVTPLAIPGLTSDAGPANIGSVLLRNSLVLALHATACLAGFIAGSSLSAEARSGLSRWIHERARPVVMAWVVLVTCFSLVTQAYALGLTGSQLALQLDISLGLLVLTVLPHAVPELVALFLPLAAWTIASRRDEWHDLLAATFATVAIAIPMLVVAATWETYGWPQLLRSASPFF